MDSDCVITKVRLQSCTDNRDPFLDVPESERMTIVCGNETLYWIAGSPAIPEARSFTCGINIFGSGFKDVQEIHVLDEDDFIQGGVSFPKVLTPGQAFKVDAVVRNLGFTEKALSTHLLLQDSIQDKEVTLESMQEASIIFSARAPTNPGVYKLRFFVSSGDLVEEEFVVIETRSVEIKGFGMPRDARAGQGIHINITLKSLEDSTGTLKLKIGEEDFSATYDLAKGQEETFTFTHTPQEAGMEAVSLVAIDSREQYQDGMISKLIVLEPDEWWGPYFAWIKGIFDSLFRMLGMAD
jgi:hypothetical protein